MANLVVPLAGPPIAKVTPDGVKLAGRLSGRLTRELAFVATGKKRRIGSV